MALHEDDPSVNQHLGFLLSSHGVPNRIEDGWHVMPNGLAMSAFLVDPQQPPGGFSSQLNVVLALAPDRAIVECFAHAARSERDLIGDLMMYFARADFHVMLSLLRGQEGAPADPCGDDQVDEETWTISGKPRRVTVGAITPKRSDDGTTHDLEFTKAFRHIELFIRSLPMDGRCHWIRVYFMQVRGGITITEFLLDNEPVAAFSGYVQQMAYVKTDGIYSYRNFMIIHAVEGNAVPAQDRAVAAAAPAHAELAPSSPKQPTKAWWRLW